MASGQQYGLVLDSEESKNIAVVHKTNQGYSGKDLWKLKQERPELFGNNAASLGSKASGGAGAPQPQLQGYEEPPDMPGWLYHRDRALYYHRESNRHYCRDPQTNSLSELHHGEDISTTLAYRGDAAACAGGSGQACRHVIISDLHRAAASMKLDFSHHDVPAAMFAVYDGRSAGGPAAEAAAKGLHVRLLPRLAAFRGRWQNDRLEAVVAESLEQLSREVSGAAEGGIGVAVALLLGGRLTLAATGGAACMLLGSGGMDDGSMDNLDVVGEGPQPATHCAILEDSHLGVLLTVAAVRAAAGLGPARLRTLARAQVGVERPRAACVSVLEEARRGGAAAPLVAAAVRFAWTPHDADGFPVKRQRTEANGLSKVRCRHILLRHVGCQAAPGGGERSRPRPTRAPNEAEALLLGILGELACGGAAAFTTRCKALSECDTALRGGDLAGDLGWLDRDPAKNRKVPVSVVRAAFALAVGQLSDIVSSERGIHLLLRTA